MALNIGVVMAVILIRIRRDTFVSRLNNTSSIERRIGVKGEYRITARRNKSAGPNRATLTPKCRAAIIVEVSTAC